MAIDLSQFALTLDSSFAVPTSQSYRPPSWPPPKDWVCIEDENGNAVSRWGDSVWNLWPWTKKNQCFNFGDGPKLRPNSPVIDPANADLLRLVMTWRRWGPRAPRAPGSTFNRYGFSMRKIFALCSENNILASDLSRYPALIEKLAKMIAPSSYEEVITELEVLRDAREILGFELLDKTGIMHLKAMQPDHETEQTEYIPPRIWTYVVTRLKECINDYFAHQKQIEDCFKFCLDAYNKNRVLEYRATRMGIATGHRNPFKNLPKNRNGSDLLYLGSFTDTALKFEIKGLLEKWVGNHQKIRSISAFSSYFSLIQYAALADVLAFTLMRADEGASIRKNCLVWHDDEVYGRVLLIQSETTKTDPDENALWVTSPSLEVSISVWASVARMRLGSAGKWEENDNPYLITQALEPWGKPNTARQATRPHTFSFKDALSRFKCLFDRSQLTITEEDFKIAKAVCPTLNADLFQIGKPWPLTWHQFRRTGAVNMFADGEVSDSTIQHQLKHLTRLMPLYYGRGNSTLHFNNDARVLLVNAQYEAMGKKLAEVQTDRYISPYGTEHIAKLFATANDGEPVNLIAEGDAQRYEKAARKQLINFRQTALGGCMKNGPCDGDCVSSIGDCAGGNGKSPCVNVLFDRTRSSANQIRLEGVIKQLELTPVDTPKFRFLMQEKRGLENYFAYIRKEA